MEAENEMKIIKVVCVGVILFFAPIIVIFVAEYVGKKTIYIHTN